MPKIRVTDETVRIIRSWAIYEYRQTGTREPDGNWLIDVSTDVADRLKEISLPGETPDDVIQRVHRERSGNRLN